MSYWVNIGVSGIDNKEEILNTIEKTDIMTVVEEDDNKLLIGTFSVAGRSVTRSEVEDIIRDEDDFNGTKVCIIDVSDNDDTAVGVVYEVSKYSLDKLYSDDSGGPGTRRKWSGINLDGFKVGTEKL